MLMGRVPVHRLDSTLLTAHDLCSTMPFFTGQIINSVDMVTQQKVFRQGRDTPGIFILKISYYWQCDRFWAEEDKYQIIM